MYQIKQIPEDFKVKEVSSLKLEKIGTYGYFILRKKGYSTLDAISIISEKIKIKTKDIGYAGNKDKHAVTEQAISIKNPNLESINNLNWINIRLEYIGSGKEPISLGDLTGNKFEIIVRNLVNEQIDEVNEKSKKILIIPNYYDEQRFSKNNVKIGMLLLKRKFKEACKLINDKVINEHLNNYKNDYVGALRMIQKRKLMLYIHSVQSFIFNETLRLLVKKGKKVKYSLGNFVFPENENQNEKIPIIGFGTEFNDIKIRNIIEKILKKLKINERDFILREIPEISSEGNFRDFLIAIKDLNIIETGLDTINKRKFFARLSFFLGKGSYATLVIKYLFD